MNLRYIILLPSFLLMSCGGGSDGGIEPPSDGGNPISNSGSSNSSTCTANNISAPNISFSRSLDPLTQPISSNQYPPYDLSLIHI